MSKKKIVSALSYVPSKALSFEKKHAGPSLTVPNESMSLRDILVKHARGIDSGVYAREPLYYGGDFDDEDYEEVALRMDMTEQQQVAEKLAAQKAEKTQRLSVLQKEEKAAAEKAAAEKEETLLNKLRAKVSDTGAGKGQGSEPSKE